MVSTFYPPYNFGGDGIYIHRLSNELARRGHRVDVVHCEDAYSLMQPAGPGIGYANHPNVTVHGLKSSVSMLSPLLTHQTGAPVFKRRKLKRLLDEGGYDVIHFHNMSLIGITALSYGPLDAVKLYTTHEHWLLCPMHVLWKFGREVCSKKSCTLCTLAGGRPPQLWRHTGLIEKMVRHVDCFISPSRFTLAKHIDSGLDIPMRHIPYFLPQNEGKADPETASATLSQYQRGDRPFFLFAGRLEKIKGVQNLIHVFRNRGEYDLVIAGDGEYRQTLEDLAEGAENVKFLGRVNRTELSKLYQEAVAVVVPSICYETFGIIIIEAFSVRTPVIVNDLGALPEVIQDSGGGLIYRSPDELDAALNRLASEPVFRDKLGTNGHEAYLKYWSEDAHMAQYMGLISEMREKRSAAYNHRN